MIYNTDTDPSRAQSIEEMRQIARNQIQYLNILGNEYQTMVNGDYF